MAFDAVLPDLLTAKEYEIERRLCNRRLRFVQQATGSASLSPGQDGIALLWLTALDRLLSESSERAVAVLGHWSTAYLLRACTGEGAASERLISSLLFESLPDGSSPLAGMRFTITTLPNGTIPILSRDMVLSIRTFHEPFTRLEWSCTDRNGAIRPEGASHATLEIALPLSVEEQSDQIEIRPAPRLSHWDLPLIEEGRHALFIDNVPEASDGAHVLPLQTSLNHAHHLIETNWPDIIPWVKALVPAIADLGPSPSAHIRLSGSYGAGLPIYLSRVRDPWCHAEDLIHELQHQRLLFAIPTEWFGRWNDFSFISPYRSDPRPLSGLHLGLHAFVGVNEFRLRFLSKGNMQSDLIRQMLRTHRENLFVYRTVLAHDKLSAEGVRFYAEMGRVLQRHGASIEPLGTAEMVQSVEAALERHAEGVRAATPSVENQAVRFGAAAPDEFAAAFHAAP
jgi:hypothetical protein